MKGAKNFLLVFPLALTCLSSLLGAEVKKKDPSAVPNVFVQGTIEHYENRPLTLFKCQADSLLFVDSVKTDEKGKFAFQISASSLLMSKPKGLFKIQLRGNQSFLFLHQYGLVQFHTIFSETPFSNITTDSLVVKNSENQAERANGFNDFVINRQLQHFQHLQQELNIANYFLLQMMRLYPMEDPFHKTIENEYAKRFQMMQEFVNQQISTYPETMSTKIAKAYFQPVLPDWKLPDPGRDSILARHYFDFFDPSDTFYLHSNILPEKMELYLALRTNKKGPLGQPIQDELLLSQAATDFLGKIKSSTDQKGFGQKGPYSFCLNYFLKEFKKGHKEKSFLSLYDSNLQPDDGECGAVSADRFSWAREYASLLKGTLIGAVAPDFELEKGGLKLSSIKSDYILLVFWASWCPHCAQLLPEVRNLTDSVREKLTTVAISVDSDTSRWKTFVTDNQLMNWHNTSELKGWQGVTPKLYNIYATPSLFLLDKERKILAKPADAAELQSWMDKFR